MPRPQDIQDLLIHSGATDGVHGMSQTPAPNATPVSADDSNFIDDGWLSDNIPKMTNGRLSAANMSPNVPLIEQGVIPLEKIPEPITGKTYYSSGDWDFSGFLIADGTDFFTAMAGHILNVSSGAYSQLATVGSTIHLNSWDCINCNQPGTDCSPCPQCNCACGSATSG